MTPEKSTIGMVMEQALEIAQTRISELIDNKFHYKSINCRFRTIRFAKTTTQ